jgi:hypothetical protein
MKMPFLIVIVGLMGLVNALADEPKNSTAAPPNPFAAPLTLNGEVRSTHDEDLANPFVEGHRIEEYYYAARYYAHYHATPVNMPQPAPPVGEPTSSVDEAGRPLWFDRASGETLLEALISILVFEKKFDDLDRLFDDWSDHADRLADGTWRLTVFHNHMAGMMSAGPNWDDAYRLVSGWRQKNPSSRAAALVEAMYWDGYAWNARGDGAASSVSEEGWKLFQERLKKAEKVLAESKPFASSSPLWGKLQLDVGLGLNWTKDEMLGAFTESASKAPYYYPLYTSMARSLLPKWGGSWKLVDDFIRAAVKNTEAVEGHSLYARLYWTVDPCNCEGGGLFKESLANWEEMKQGFEDLSVRYPHSAWIVNQFAAYACIAGDKAMFQRLRLKIGKTIVPTAWPANNSLDLCEHKFPAQPL